MKNIISDELYNKLLNIYGEEYLLEIDIKLFITNYKYLINEGYYFIEDIIINYIWILQLDNNSLVEVSNKLKNEYGDNYLDIICKDISIYERYF